MDEGDSKNNKKTKNKGKQITFDKRPLFDVGSLFQSFWVRCRSVFPNITDRKFMESQLHIVLYCGIVFWFVYLLLKILK